MAFLGKRSVGEEVWSVKRTLYKFFGRANTAAESPRGPLSHTPFLLCLSPLSQSIYVVISFFLEKSLKPAPPTPLPILLAYKHHKATLMMTKAAILRNSSLLSECVSV